MTTGPEMLKASEAAVVARVSLRDINRVIDENILPDPLVSLANGRHIAASACTLIAFYFETARQLTAEQRLSAIRSALSRLRRWDTATTAMMLKADWTVRDDFLTIDLRPFVERAMARLAQLHQARRSVTTSPDILGGTPVMRGTRIPVHDVAAALAAGTPERDILDDYPALSRENVALAALYAEANPLRGRPRPLRPRLPRGTTKIAERHVTRRPAG